MSSGAGMTVVVADCIEHMRSMDEHSVDAVVCDPPYALSFMGKPWDAYDGREDSGFAYWLAGFIDGEGCFTIKGHARGTYAPSFRIKVRDDDRGILEGIRRTLGIGSVAAAKASGGSQGQATWTVQDKAGCQRLVDLLDKYPLRAKKRNDYLFWREAVCEWTERPRGNRWDGAADQTRMKALRDGLMEGRRYTEVPWSGHEFQDWCRLWASECLRVLKPGGHLLAFGGSRTYHRLAAGIEDAGFEIRDCLAWMYGVGFPKSLDVSKAIDKAAGAEREVIGEGSRHALKPGPSTFVGNVEERGVSLVTAPATAGAAQWQGWGTALKPAFEPVVVARKPLVGTVAANVLAHGTGALNIDGCRIGDTVETWPASRAWGAGFVPGGDRSRDATQATGDAPPGRWPANVVLDEVAADLLDEQTGEMRDGVAVQRNLSDEGSRQGEVRVKPPTQRGADVGYGGSGGASRFFYCAKASSAERNAGLSHDGKICSCRELEDQALSPQRDTSGPIEAGDSDCSTIGNGSSITDRSLMDSRSTTSTRTRPTTGSKTSRSSAPSITSESTAPTIAATPTESGSDSATSVASGSHQPSSTTTSAEKAGLSTADADRATSRSSSEPSSSASNACPDCGGVIEGGRRNVHPLEPTVKPVELMRWLIRLVTPPGGTILDPFTGSGTTGIAAHLEGFEFLGIEREPEYAEIARARIEWWRANTDAGAPTDAVLKVERDPAQLDLLGGEAA